MLVATIEIWPWGSSELRYKVGEITLGNITAAGAVSTYEVRVQQDAYDEAGVAEICEEFLLRDRDRSAGPLALIRAALAIAVPKLEDNVGKVNDES
ncbi:hypothetical protein [Sphingopyxis witflariensis]|uniref:Uncharacterized protein n=1 Tax=Sphingopyxis witflariensis TaxID=173675 RepID=A0A246JYW4_9SPHN|nr:hypothetical protein [Sphingopyxis witflariensis]OWQ98368.1 hypothetical protein CDQ91_07695 [Sphingopyxis witflariensis]